MTIQSIKKKVLEEFDELFVGGIFTTKERKEITKQFLSDSIKEAYEEGEKDKYIKLTTQFEKLNLSFQKRGKFIYTSLIKDYGGVVL